MEVPEFRVELELAALVGQEFTAFAQSKGYWHLFVALCSVAGNAFVFSTQARAVGPRFEVFPISVAREEVVHEPWRALATPFRVVFALPLWRYEWIVSGANGPTLGSEPNTQYAGRGPSPSESLSSARVQAGVILEDAAGECLLVAASDSAPFNVELYQSRDDVLLALQRFERLSPNLSIERTSSSWLRQLPAAAHV